ncbi:MAG: hypothetical protein V4580_03185 [Bacteroidota bacterium]
MKNYIVLIIIIIVLSNKTFAQLTKDSLPTKKNELTVDLIPLIKILSQIDGKIEMKGSLNYKRQIKPKLFIRFGIVASQKKLPQKYSDVQVAYWDSVTDVVSFKRWEYKPEFNITTGIEYRWGKKRVKQFTGLDVGYVHRREIYSTYQKYVSSYSGYNPNYVDMNMQGMNSSSSANINNAMTSSYSTTYNGVLINPFYGVQYHFSNRFFFSMQLGLQLQLLIGERTTIMKNPSGIYYSGRFSEIDLGNGGILNNFSLGFRF